MMNKKADISNFTGLFFGSFNPIHNGHLMIANHLLAEDLLKEIWFVISPHNPLKEKHQLLLDYHRLEMVEKALEGEEHMRGSDIEFRLPKPSYTIDTMVHLEEKHPERSFALIMGEDNLYTLHKWKNARMLTDRFPIVVYPRPDSREPDHQGWKELVSGARIIYSDAPLMEVSSSYIRRQIKGGKDVRFFMPPDVWKYIREMHFYE